MRRCGRRITGRMPAVAFAKSATATAPGSPPGARAGSPNPTPSGPISADGSPRHGPPIRAPRHFPIIRPSACRVGAGARTESVFRVPRRSSVAAGRDRERMALRSSGSRVRPAFAVVRYGAPTCVAPQVLGGSRGKGRGGGRDGDIHAIPAGQAGDAAGGDRSGLPSACVRSRRAAGGSPASRTGRIVGSPSPAMQSPTRGGA